MKTAETILSETVQKHKPSLIICSYSGGYDSMVATHKALKWAKRFAHSTNILTVAIDTRIHADGWPEYVRKSAMIIGARRFEIWQSKRFPEWINGIQEHGFGYTKAIHTIYFRQLKEAAFAAILAYYKTHRHDRIMFVTGVRRSESKERANTPESDRKGSNVWCNPLVNWSKQDIHEYRLAHDLPENPFYKFDLGSGDCLCNWVKNLDLKALEKHATEAAKIIAPLDSQCRLKFGYGYGEEPSQHAAQEAAGQLRLFDDSEIPNLCAGCERPKASNEHLENLLMQRIAW
jgi:3'-phosphoadenosine 5'-phosphosulfate sulfotransferase (PAPS reductase)/FAD synthetase